VSPTVQRVGALAADAVFLTSAVSALTLAAPRGTTDRTVLLLAGVAALAALGVRVLWAQRGEPREPGMVSARVVRPLWSDAGVGCPEGMARIRGGTFQMGSDDGQPHERPVHGVTLGDFCIDRMEVSVAAYRACVAASACTAPDTYVSTHGQYRVFCNWDRPGAEDHPVNCVDWSQARSFCAWGGNRLPGEAEWEYAACGSAGRTYPWGNAAPDSTRANLCGDECVAYTRSVGHSFSGIAGWRDPFGATAPVTSYESSATPEGVRNLAGNVWEWVEDEYLSDAYAQHTREGHLRPRDASGTSQATELRVLRRVLEPSSRVRACFKTKCSIAASRRGSAVQSSSLV